MKSSAQLREALAGLDRHAEALTANADAISLDAVSGNEDARKSLAGLLRQIDQAAAERSILLTALEQAQQVEAVARAEAEAGRRAEALQEAQGGVARLLDLASAVDQMQARFLPLLADIAETERAIWNALRAAGASPSTAIVGRHDLAGLAMGRLGIAAQGKAIFASDRRSIAEIARAAWQGVAPMQTEEAA